MDIDNLTIGDARRLAAMFGGEAAEQREKGDGRYVIVRSRDAGVLFGQYAGRVGNNIDLTNARQMWRWKAVKGGTLIDCATHGVDGSNCKFSPARATVTVFGACALIDCTSEAASSINAVNGGDWS